LSIYLFSYLLFGSNNTVVKYSLWVICGQWAVLAKCKVFRRGGHSAMKNAKRWVKCTIMYVYSPLG